MDVVGKRGEVRNVATERRQFSLQKVRNEAPDLLGNECIRLII